MPRQDLNKVLVEHERIGSGMKHHYVRGQNRDGKQKIGAETWPFHGESGSPFPFKEGIKKPYGYDTKNFSENLNPLYGFLRKSVGGNWNKIYSDLCKVFDKRKVINQHILIHLFQTVEVNTFMHGGKVCFTNTNAYRAQGIQTVEKGHFDFYVHPVSHILLANKNKLSHRQVYAEQNKKAVAERNSNIVLLSKFNNQNGNGARYALKINDIWYEISVIKKPAPIKCRRVKSDGEVEYYTRYPEINDISIYGAKYEPSELTGNEFYVSRKVQLNTSRLKSLGLK